MQYEANYSFRKAKIVSKIKTVYCWYSGI